MLFDMATPFPSLSPNTLYSFSQHPIASRSYLHSTLLAFDDGDGLGPQAEQPPKFYSSARMGPYDVTGTGAATPEIKGMVRPRDKEDCMRRRAERRAVMGRPPAGVMLDIQEEKISMDEDRVGHEEHNVNMFGHRFLLPYGRRQTQMEMDSAPSPSPTEPDHEHRQEDAASVPTLAVGEEDETPTQDLDASIEDLDADSALSDTDSHGRVLHDEVQDMDEE
ncbi:uncharacterized protein L203_103224 [Cryptococcus depauperatus CBS 7841]|uniref:Uncharacterized protein n=1 Tax=Cryptococcus depauperatus CBS 7841 TaxID=1295531 RepID=A0AAJ8JT67_9TREE